MKKLKNLVIIGIIMVLLFCCSSISYAGAVSPEDRPGGSGSTWQPGQNPYAPGQDPQLTERNTTSSGSGSSTGILGESTTSGSHTPDEIIGEADDFLSKGKENGSPISQDNMKAASDSLFNVLASIGIFLSVAIGCYLGVKFMFASAEDKAKVKESLIPYLAGCIIIFGAFAIWKITIELLSAIDKTAYIPYHQEYTLAQEEVEQNEVMV